MTYVKGKVSEEVKEQFKIAAKEYDGGMGALIGDLIVQYLNDGKVDTSDESTLEKRDATIEGLKDKTMMQEATITEQSQTIEHLQKTITEQVTAIEHVEKEISKLGNMHGYFDELTEVAEYLGENVLACAKDIIQTIGKQNIKRNEEVLTILGLQQTDAFDNVSFKDCLSDLRERMDNNVLIDPDTFYPIGTALGIEFRCSKTEYVSACIDEVIKNIDMVSTHKTRIADLETELETIGNHFGVSDTPEHIIQRIEECRSEVRNHINKLKARITQVKTIAENKHKQLQGYVTQGFIGRLFREIPTPCGNLDWNGDGEKPEATTLDESLIGKDKENA